MEPNAWCDSWRERAEDLRGAIRCGVLRLGDPLPPMVELGKRYDVAASTVHRAIATLADAGQIAVSRGKRATVAVEAI